MEGGLLVTVLAKNVWKLVKISLTRVGESFAPQSCRPSDVDRLLATTWADVGDLGGAEFEAGHDAGDWVVVVLPTAARILEISRGWGGNNWLKGPTFGIVDPCPPSPTPPVTHSFNDALMIDRISL